MTAFFAEDILVLTGIILTFGLCFVSVTVNVLQILVAFPVTMRINFVERVEDWWPWPWGGDDEPENIPDLNPVLLVPGIGGSILHAINEKGRKERIWVRLFAADHEFRAKLYSLYDPLTGKTNTLDPNTTIEVPDDRYGLYSCDILDPAVVIFLIYGSTTMPSFLFSFFCLLLCPLCMGLGFRVCRAV